MAKPRVTATDRLANVIEVVELGQRTGLLSVERGLGSVLEEGEIFFAAGRVIYASMAGLRGREALAALSRWGPCRFAFDRDAPRPAPNIASPSTSEPGASSQDPRRSAPSTPSQYPSYPASTFGESSGSWPMHLDPRSSGSTYIPREAGYPTANPRAGSMPFGSTAPLESGMLPPAGASGMLPPAGASGMLPPAGASGMLPPAGASGVLPQAQPQPPNLLARRPRRAPDVRDLMAVVTRHNLSRSHRTILLLADGEHTLLDLARLSSKSIEEVLALLTDLETRGLVYYYG